MTTTTVQSRRKDGAPLAILGGGPAGLGVAYFATRAGLSFRLFEKQDAVGGLCRTFRCGEHLYDSGAHRLHDRDAEITCELRRLMGDRLTPVSIQSRIFDSGRFVDFPPSPLNLILSSSPRDVARIGYDLLRARRLRRPVVSFADFAVREFGEVLARRFLLSFSEKLWGLPASQLSLDVATRRLGGMRLSTLLLELCLPERKTEHIDGRFLYPRGGFGEIANTLARTLPADRLHTSHEVSALTLSHGRITSLVFTNGLVHEPEGIVVSTLPLTLVVNMLGPELDDEAHEAASRLRFRSVRLIFLRLMQDRLSSDASIYFPDPQMCVSRVFEPRNRSPLMSPEGETSLIAETPCFVGDRVYALENEELKDSVIHELAQVGLLRPDAVCEWRHHLLEYAYPVYSLDYHRWVSVIRRKLAAIRNLHMTGRNGLFYYSHLHDQLRLAKQFVAGLGV
jgi:protoporphyrinogen oxidase